MMTANPSEESNHNNLDCRPSKPFIPVGALSDPCKPNFFTTGSSKIEPVAFLEKRPASTKKGYLPVSSIIPPLRIGVINEGRNSERDPEYFDNVEGEEKCEDKNEVRPEVTSGTDGHEYTGQQLTRPLTFPYKEDNTKRRIVVKAATVNVAGTTKQQGPRGASILTNAIIRAKIRLRNKLISNFTSNTSSYNAKITESIMYGANTHLVCIFKEYLIYDDTNEFLRRFYAKSEVPARLKMLSNFYTKFHNARPNYAILEEKRILIYNIVLKRRLARNKRKSSTGTSPRPVTPAHPKLFTTEFFKELDKDDQNLSKSRVVAEATQIQSYLKSKSNSNRNIQKPTEPPQNRNKPSLPAFMPNTVVEPKVKVQNVDGTIPNNDAEATIPLKSCRLVATGSPRRVVNFKSVVKSTGASPQCIAVKFVQSSQSTPIKSSHAGPARKEESSVKRTKERESDTIIPLSVKLRPEPLPREERKGKGKKLLRRKTCEDIPDDIKMLSLKYGREVAPPENTLNKRRAVVKENSIAYQTLFMKPPLPKIVAANFPNRNSARLPEKPQYRQTYNTPRSPVIVSRIMPNTVPQVTKKRISTTTPATPEESLVLSSPKARNFERGGRTNNNSRWERISKPLQYVVVNPVAAFSKEKVQRGVERRRPTSVIKESHVSARG
eukprot:TRINITY_DN71068_c1_g1_i1.p1 TRINITY_DN71068_c1_g1~~TRINITY_DN71068_c1_g1_i1.p1  ORF type:complete len:664 (+),score=39.79 TRINITY_DN71068_c1_g1_i1:158-2149(+)